ncbi:Type II secretion system protein E [Mycobacteroides abscessus subsp. abscessus]|nr:Type II secretion system protein E [Mycobacteroides abscessus subsp. abscessus]
MSGSGTLISLRVLGTRRLGISDLEACGTLPGEVGTLLRALVASRANVLVSGATGSGKTTLLSAALALVPAGERIVCIEEVAEIAPAHPHCVHLIERAPNVEGRGAVTLADLVRAAMRMRPDRLVLGECRGPEVRDVLTALNTGHDGGWATIHANGVRDVPARLAALGALAAMSESAVAAQAASAIDAVLHLRRSPSGHRWVSEVGVLTCARGSLECVLALSATADGCVTMHEAWSSLARRVRL